MNFLIKKARIVYPGHPLHHKQLDIHIKDGKINKLGRGLRAHKTEIIDMPHVHISPGWLDINTFLGEPGFEHRETFESVTRSAKAGGYTALAPAPNTYPVADHKTSIHYLYKQSRDSGINVYALGAITVACEGRDIAEMIDMHHAGVAAFTDGLSSIQSGGVMLRALQYVKAFNGLIMNHPFDTSLAEEGLIHEGKVSTSLGMKGIPSLTETMMLQRDLDLLEYSGSRLHVLNISSRHSVDLIRIAKSSQLDITSSVPVMNLVATDRDCSNFNYNFKVLPPLREESDRDRLYNGLKKGLIDGITANHVPVDTEAKKLEFAHAAFGAIGLETSFALFNSAYSDDLDLWVDCLAIRNRGILGLKPPFLEEGKYAELTLFNPKMKWTLEDDKIESKSRNTPFVGREFTGKVLGVINGLHYTLFEP